MKTQTIILAVTACCLLSGCAKIRQLTRGDYAVLNEDPFLDSPMSAEGHNQLAATAAAPAANGAEGYARVPGNAAATRTTAATQAASMGQPANPFRTASQSRTIVPEGTTEGLARIAAGGSAAEASGNSGLLGKHEPMDMAEMSQFMKAQAEASGLDDTAKDLEDFEAFMASRDEEWNEKVQQVKQQAASEIQQVSDEFEAFADSEWPSVPAMAYEAEQNVRETAQPLIQDFANQAGGAVQQFQAQATQAVAEMPNPFVDQVAATATPESNPFEELSMEDGFSPFEDMKQAAQQTVNSGRATASQVKHNVQQQFDDFAAFAETELTGRVQTQSKPTVEPNPFQLLNSRPANGGAASTQRAPATRAVSQSRTLPAFPEPAQQKAEKLDQKFNFDVGWRPSNMERR